MRYKSQKVKLAKAKSSGRAQLERHEINHVSQSEHLRSSYPPIPIRRSCPEDVKVWTRLYYD